MSSTTPRCSRCSSGWRGGTRPGRSEARILGAALLLAGAVALGLGLGAVVQPPEAWRDLAVPALGVQTLLTVGALPRRDRSVRLRPALVLLLMHHLLASVPMAVVGIAVGLDEPLGFGLFLIAAAPPAALIPAYADVAEVPGGDLLAFVLIAYAVALGLTPLLVYLGAGEVVGVGTIGLTLGGGLVVPAILARALHPQIARLGQRARRAAVNATVAVICFGLGGGIVEGLGSSQVGAGGLALTAVALAVRSFGGAAVAARFAPLGLRAQAPLAVAFKNVALAAAVGGSLLGAAAALPGLIGFGVEILCFVVIARRRSGRPRAPG